MMNDSGSEQYGEQKVHGGAAVHVESAKKLVLETFDNPEKKKQLTLWGSFFAIAFLIWMVFSSGDFSFLLTFAALWRCFGLLMMNYKVWIGKSVKGISAKTMQLYCLVFASRLLSIIRHQGYLPFDKTGDWFYHVIEFLSFGSVGLVLYGIMGPLKSTYDSRFDKFGNLNVPNEYGIVYLLVPTLLLAIIFHPELNKEFFSDTCWTFSMYLEAVAMIPQLYMFQKQAGDQAGTVEQILGHVTFALGFSRIFELCFWFGSFKELSNASGKAPGYIVLISQVGQLLIMGDFFYYYLLSVSRGVPMELPTNNISMNV
jgi:ER lumen protein retaining receptor